MILEICTRCKQQFPKEKMYTFWHGFGGIRVCNPCWDKLEEAEGNK